MIHKLSKNQERLLKVVAEFPGQTAKDYQAMTNAQDEQAGTLGRTIKVDSMLHSLNARGFVTRSGNPYLYAAASPQPRTTPESRRSSLPSPANVGPMGVPH